MKIWSEFGSSHSGNVTIIGEFNNESMAQQAYNIVEDFVMAAWEERYPNIEAFYQAWKAREPRLANAMLNNYDFEIGIDNTPEISIAGKKVQITNLRSENISGIIKLFFINDSQKTTITGQGA